MTAISPYSYALAESVEEFKQGVSEFVAMLADYSQKKISLVFQGITASCEYNPHNGWLHIIVPQVDTLALRAYNAQQLKRAQAFLAATMGYLYHELGHAFFTDWQLIRQVDASGDALLKTLVNIGEDSYVERQMLKRYKGSRHYLDAVLALVRAKVAVSMRQETWDVPKQFIQALTHKVRVAYDAPQEDFIAGMFPAVMPMLSQFSVEIEALSKAESTAEVVAAARVLADKLRQQEEDESEEESEEEAEEDDEEDKSEEETEEDKSEEDESEEDESEEDSPASLDVSSLFDASSGDAAAAGIERAIADELHELLVCGSHVKDDTGARRWVAYTTQHDEVIYHKRPLDTLIGKTSSFEHLPQDQQDKIAAQYLATAMKTTQPLVDTLCRKLQNAIMSKTRERRVYDQEEGVLEPEDLYRVALRHRRVFQDIYQAKGNHKISIVKLVDLSGSMGGRKLEVARLGNLLFGDFLDRFRNQGLQFTIAGYHADCTRAMIHKAEQLPVAERRLFTRFGASTIEVFKAFNMPWRTRREFVTTMAVGANTYPGEAIMWGVKESLTHCKGHDWRRILFVWEDGVADPTPADDEASALAFHKHAVQRAKQLGFEVIGIGVQSDHVQNIYEHYAVVNDLETLVHAELHQLERILTNRS